MDMNNAKEAIKVLVEDGMLELVGTDPDGEPLYAPTEKGLALNKELAKTYEEVAKKVSDDIALLWAHDLVDVEMALSSSKDVVFLKENANDALYVAGLPTEVQEALGRTLAVFAIKGAK